MQQRMSLQCLMQTNNLCFYLMEEEDNIFFSHCRGHFGSHIGKNQFQLTKIMPKINHNLLESNAKSMGSLGTQQWNVGIWWTCLTIKTQMLSLQLMLKILLNESCILAPHLNYTWWILSPQLSTLPWEQTNEYQQWGPTLNSIF